MDSPNKAGNKIMDIVRLQQLLKKWKRLSVSQKSRSKKSINVLKKTFSFSETTTSSSSSSVFNTAIVPKGYLAICVGKEMKRFVIPMEYLGHKAFQVLLQEAEEEFGFQNEGVLKIPCEVPLFQNILKILEKKKNKFGFHQCYSEADLTHEIQCLQKQICS